MQLLDDLFSDEAFVKYKWAKKEKEAGKAHIIRFLV